MYTGEYDSNSYTFDQCLQDLQNYQKSCDDKNFHVLLRQIRGIIDLHYQAEDFKHFKYLDSRYISEIITVLQQVQTYLINLDNKYGNLPKSCLPHGECEKIVDNIYEGTGYYLDEISRIIKAYLPMLVASWNVMDDYIMDKDKSKFKNV